MMSMSGEEAAVQARRVLWKMDNALAARDAEALASCFFPFQAHWVDQLGLTCHLRTMTGPPAIAAGLIETSGLRERTGEIAAPTLQLIDSDLTFRTYAPQATCRGTILLLPPRNYYGGLEWKIWVLSTKLEKLDLQPDDESLLLRPSEPLGGSETFKAFLLSGAVTRKLNVFKQKRYLVICELTRPAPSLLLGGLKR